jgi:hypothetical protein
VSTRTVVLSAAVSNVIVVTATCVLSGWNATGAHAAARNSARLSALWFALAFAAPGLTRLFGGLPAPATLVYSFFAAHCVHFATVAVLLTTFDFSHVMQNPTRAAAVVAGGFALVLVAAGTAIPSASWTYRYLHRTALYAIFLIFFFAFARHSSKPLRVLAALLAMSFFLRLASELRLDSPRVNSAA